MCSWSAYTNNKNIMAHASLSVAALHVCFLSCIVLTLGTVLVSSQTTTVSILPEFTSEPREGDAVTLRCEVLGFQSSVHSLSWVAVFPDKATILTWQGMLDSRITDPAYTLVNHATSDPSTEPEVHSVVVSPASQRHNGMYTCRVLELKNGNSYSVVSSVQTVLTVYPAWIFPSCSPSDAASLSEGSSISCTVAANTTALVVAGNGAPEDWVTGPLDPGPRSRLTALVTTADNGATFNCSSIAADFPDVTLGCQIGPLFVFLPTTAASSTHQRTVYGQTESSTTVSPAAISASTVVVIVITILLIIVVIVIISFILHRRKGRLRPLDTDQDKPTPNGASSPPPEKRQAENGKTAPHKPVPNAVRKQHPSEQAPVVYTSVPPGRGKVAPEVPPEGGIYATVHNEHEAPSKQGAQPVHYASINKDRKSRQGQNTEPPHYAAVNKLKDSRETTTNPAQYAAVQRNVPRASDIASMEDGLVYAELDLVNHSDGENKKPVPKEEPTVYAELANLK